MTELLKAIELEFRFTAALGGNGNGDLRMIWLSRHAGRSLDFLRGLTAADMMRRYPPRARRRR